MRTVLFISYLFPPHGGPGVQRTLSFARHLPALGWRPIVVAGVAGKHYWAEDQSLLERVPPEAEVHRISEGRAGEAVRLLRRAVPGRLRARVDRALLVPDRQMPWYRPARDAAIALAEQHGAEVIYATGAPWTDLLVGASVAGRLGLPLVADFRDPWTDDDSVFTAATPVHRRVHRALERKVHEAAVVRIANTHGNAEEMARSFPTAEGEIVVIPNGWDEEDFTDELPPEPSGLRVGFAGNFYAGRRPREVLSLFADAREISTEVETELELELIGNTGAAEDIAALGLEGVVRERGYLPLPETLRRLAACRVTLVTVPAGARRGWVPQKLYQQLRLGRPVLTLAPPGDAADITVAAGQPWVDVDRADAGAALAHALERVLRGEVAPPSLEHAAPYERGRLAQGLVEAFERHAS